MHSTIREASELHNQIIGNEFCIVVYGEKIDIIIDFGIEFDSLIGNTNGPECMRLKAPDMRMSGRLRISESPSLTGYQNVGYCGCVLAQ